jgi:hypothetical protein
MVRVDDVPNFTTEERDYMPGIGACLLFQSSVMPSPGT